MKVPTLGAMLAVADALSFPTEPIHRSFGRDSRDRIFRNGPPPTEQVKNDARHRAKKKAKNRAARKRR
jgi:hypothetical protein